VLVEIGRLFGDAADHDAIAEHVEHQDCQRWSLLRLGGRRPATLVAEMFEGGGFTGPETPLIGPRDFPINVLGCYRFPLAPKLPDWFEAA
jgi:hypothetical protein